MGPKQLSPSPGSPSPGCLPRRRRSRSSPTRVHEPPCWPVPGLGRWSPSFWWVPWHLSQAPTWIPGPTAASDPSPVPRLRPLSPVSWLRLLTLFICSAENLTGEIQHSSCSLHLSAESLQRKSVSVGVQNRRSRKNSWDDFGAKRWFYSSTGTGPAVGRAAPRS